MDFNDRRQVEMAPTRGTISHLKARQISSDWHGGQGSAMYALSSAGTIAPHLVGEIDRTLGEATTKKETRRLTQLRRYAEKSGVRGPVRDWANTLNW